MTVLHTPSYNTLETISRNTLEIVGEVLLNVNKLTKKHEFEFIWDVNEFLKRGYQLDCCLDIL